MMLPLPGSPIFMPSRPFKALSPAILPPPPSLSRPVHLPAVFVRPGMRVPGLRPPHTETTESRLLHFEHQFFSPPLERAVVHGEGCGDLALYVIRDSPRARAGTPSPIPEGVTADLLPRLVSNHHLRRRHTLTIAGEDIRFPLGSLKRRLEADDLSGAVWPFRRCLE